MRKAKIQVLLSCDDVGVWRIVAPIDVSVVRHITEQEIATLTEAIPRLIESIVKERPPESVKPKDWLGKGGPGQKKK